MSSFLPWLNGVAVASYFALHTYIPLPWATHMCSSCPGCTRVPLAQAAHMYCTRCTHAFFLHRLHTCISLAHFHTCIPLAQAAHMFSFCTHCTLVFLLHWLHTCIPFLLHRLHTCILERKLGWSLMFSGSTRNSRNRTKTRTLEVQI